MSNYKARELGVAGRLGRALGRPEGGSIFWNQCEAPRRIAGSGSTRLREEVVRADPTGNTQIKIIY